MQSLIASSRPGPRLRAAVGGVNLPAADPASLDLVTREPIFHRNRQIGSRRAMSCHCAAIGHEDTMPEVIINGTEGRIEGRYLHAPESNAPIAHMLHPHPQHGGTMNNKEIGRASGRDSGCQDV